MLFSRRSASDDIELPADPAELARRLTLAGLAVETMEEKGDDVLFDIDVTTNRPDCTEPPRDRPRDRGALRPAPEAAGGEPPGDARRRPPPGCGSRTRRGARAMSPG